MGTKHKLIYIENHHRRHWYGHKAQINQLLSIGI
jgi:hypothetical protein